MCGDIPRAIEAGLLQNQTILRLTKNGPEITGEKTRQQGAEVEAAAYAEKVRMAIGSGSDVGSSQPCAA